MKLNKEKLASKLSIPITCYDKHGNKITATNWPVASISNELYNTLIRCNMASYGCMQGMLKRIYGDGEDAWITVCTQDQQVLGWGLVCSSSWNGKTALEFNVYIRKQHRRRGLASIIYKQAAKIAKDLIELPMRVSPHDRISKSFFVEAGIPTRYWSQ